MEYAKSSLDVISAYNIDIRSTRTLSAVFSFPLIVFQSCKILSINPSRVFTIMFSFVLIITFYKVTSFLRITYYADMCRKRLMFNIMSGSTHYVVTQGNASFITLTMHSGRISALNFMHSVVLKLIK